MLDVLYRQNELLERSIEEVAIVTVFNFSSTSTILTSLVDRISKFKELPNKLKLSEVAKTTPMNNEDKCAQIHHAECECVQHRNGHNCGR